MARVYVFVDEAGDFIFKRKAGVSTYFIIGTVTMKDCQLGNDLIDLRRELAWNGFILPEFHAHNDVQRVRDRVFDVLAGREFRVDTTILDKTKAQDHLRADPLRFYKEAWFLHFKHVAPRIATSLDDLFVVASSLQIKRKKQAIHHAVADVVRQVSPTVIFHTAFWPAISDPCLQVADYATWAIQRKYERGDTRSHDLIADKIASEFEAFKLGPKTYY
ncbi:MAG: DUF3800 domain-containing protein [Actinomycetota bacterium]